MKLVLDASAAAKWYVREVDAAKAARLRVDFHMGRHELIAPDTFHAHSADVFVTAERQGLLDPGEAAGALNDLLIVGVVLQPAAPLLPRAIELALSARLTVMASLYVALAEREQCQFLTADQRVVRAARKHFPFVITFAALP